MKKPKLTIRRCRDDETRTFTNMQSAYEWMREEYDDYKHKLDLSQFEDFACTKFELDGDI